MRTRKIIYFFSILFIFILCTCNDPVFYAISKEIKPIEPRISGVPTNFAVFNGRMYVAGGDTLYSYKYSKTADSWKREPRPGGNILQVASTGDSLYVLCATNKDNDGRTVIKRLTSGSWTQMGGILDNYAKIQNIFDADDVLFILAALSKSNYDYNLLYIKNGANAKIIKNNNLDDFGIITGAASNGTSYFLPFTSRKTDNGKTSGVYRIDDLTLEAKVITDKENTHFNGIINLNDSANTILLISRKGEIYTVDSTIEKINNVSLGRAATGALAIWCENDQSDSKRLLLAGKQDSLYYTSSYGYSFGYMELELDADGVKSGSNFSQPGRNTVSTVKDPERYQSSMGKYPINYIFQAPSNIDSNMTLFASTQKNGVWSCRDRDNNSKKYWNAEGENEP